MLIDRQDILYVLRSARRTPLLTLVVVLALSVGIGLNAGVFTVLDYFWLQPPTHKDPSSFAQIYPRYEGLLNGDTQFASFNTQDYDAIRAQAHALADVAAWQPTGAILDDTHYRTPAALVTCNYFRVFGIDRPLMGRLFLPEECRPGTSLRLTVLSEHLWRSSFSADPLIVGKVIHVSGLSLTVIGVSSDRAANLIITGLWVPYTLQPEFNHGNSAFTDPAWTWLQLAGRLRPGYTRADAGAELQTLLRVRDRLYLQQKVFTLDRRTSLLLTNGSFIRNPIVQSRGVMVVCLIMGPLSLVLLLACTNVTMLFLSRSIVRRGEIAVRLALGAGRPRLLRMLILESFFTAVTAGLASMYLAAHVPSLLFSAVDPEQGIAASSMQPDWVVFCFLAALVLVATIVSALAPLRESFRFDLVTALKGREGAATMRSRTTSALIIVQLAMSFVLLVAAVIFARIPATMVDADPGFETHHNMTVPLDIRIPPYAQASALAFYHSLEARILALPGVQSLAYATIMPFYGAPISEVRFEKQARGQGRPAVIDTVTENFFSTFGIALLRGRAFQHTDVSATTSAPVAVVSAAFARAFWPGADPMGKVVVTPDDRHLVVIGVARDTASEQFSIPDGPRLYTLRAPQALDGQLFVRFSGDSARLASAISVTVKSLDSSQVNTPSTIWDSLEDNADRVRSLARIIMFMAAIAVLLAITGVYAVLTFAIQRRTREFGIQMMLGATRTTIFRALITRGIRQISIALFCGCALAMPAAWAFRQFTRGSALQIDAFDVSVYAASALILAAVSLSAMFLPALRATQINPIDTLRNE